MLSNLKSYKRKLEERKCERLKLEQDLGNLEEKQNTTDTSSNNGLSSQLESEIEIFLINYLNDPLVDLPLSSDEIMFKLDLKFQLEIQHEFLNKLLFKFSNVYKLIELIETYSKHKSEEDACKRFKVTSVNTDRIDAYLKRILKVNNCDDETKKTSTSNRNELLSNKVLNKNATQFLERLLAQPSALERESRRNKIELNELLMESTAKERLEMERFKSIKSHVQEYCPHGVREECVRYHMNKNMLHKKCEKIHFKRILKPHTDVSLGDCSFLNTCYNINNCKYIHYEVDMEDVNQEITLNSQAIVNRIQNTRRTPPQWIQCDLRTFDMTILGKFSVIMADPPWDIHMELPYGTMADEEMKKLDIPSLQDEGYIFLWVTGRAMELGRECLKEWNYERCDELIWVKTNQLQRIIRTGRTGHWLNHGKEHCLVGVKGKPNPELFNTGIDCDVIVAEVRATSHKPDEIYGIIERLSPGTRKVELFGRPHNIKPNWVTLGNQLDGIKIIDPNIIKKFKTRYPDGNVMPNVSN